MFCTSSFFIFSGYLTSYKKVFHSFIKKAEGHLPTIQISINPSQLFVNTSLIKWEDDNQEIKIEGEMYDIVSMHSEHGKVIITLLSDIQEDVLKKEFASNYDVQSNKTSNSPIKLLKQFFALKFIQNNDKPVNGLLCNVVKSSIIETTFELCSVVLNNETPPPSLFV